MTAPLARDFHVTMAATQSDRIASKGASLQAVGWIRGGWRTLQTSPPLWFGMAAIYLFGAALLEAIPFVGHLVLVLLSPMLLAGALHALPPTSPRPPSDAVTAYLRAPVRQLLQGFATEARVYRAVLSGIVIVGLVVLVAIAQYFVGTNSVTAELAAARHGVAHTAAAALRLIASGVLYALLFMALFFAVHRTVYARREPLAALAESFNACQRHAIPLLILALLFLLPVIAIAGAFHAAPWFGYAALAVVGVPALSLFVLASYRSYCDVFGTPTND